MICKRHKIDGRIGAKRAFIDEKETLEIMNKINSSLEDSDTSKCTSSQDDGQ